MNPWLTLWIGLCAGSMLGFLLAAILTVGKRSDLNDEDDGPLTHCEGDGQRLVHLIAKNYSINRNGEFVALLQPDTNEIAFIGRSLRDLLDRSMAGNPTLAEEQKVEPANG